MGPLAMGALLAEPEVAETGLVWPALFLAPLFISGALAVWLAIRATRRWGWLGGTPAAAGLGIGVVAINPGSRLFDSIAGGAWAEAVGFHLIGIPAGWVQIGPLVRDAEFGLLLTAVGLTALAPLGAPLIALYRARRWPLYALLALALAASSWARWPRDLEPPAAPAGAPEWIQIPAGTWTIGSPEDEYGRNPDEQIREVTLDVPGALMSVEVSQHLWSTLRSRDAARADAWSIPAAPWVYAGPDLPATGVSWCDAARWLNHWSLSEGLTPVYTIGGDPALPGCEDGAPITDDPDTGAYRLPSEYEWEVAARAGSDAQYAGGVDLDAVAWHLGNARLRPHPVGGKRANAWGLHDMSGNAMEWVFERYRSTPDAQPYAGRVVRSGSYRSFAPGVRASLRFWFLPGFRTGIVGFRAAKG